MPRAGGVQIIPPYYAYSGNRGMQRALFDLKSDDGREAFLALADDADVIIEIFRPGRGRQARHRLRRGVRRATHGIVYCSTSGLRPDRAPRGTGPATT